jgi:hypothetical protein
MYDFKRNFGRAFDEALRKSPTLAADVKKLYRRKIKIRRVYGQCRAYFSTTIQTIFIGSSCDLVRQLQYLAHEASHALYDRPVAATNQKLTRRQFINKNITNEVNAVMHELKVLQELHLASFPLDAVMRSWLRLYEVQGRGGLRSALENSKTSTTDESYSDYYSRSFDEQ